MSKKKNMIVANPPKWTIQPDVLFEEHVNHIHSLQHRFAQIIPTPPPPKSPMQERPDRGVLEVIKRRHFLDTPMHNARVDLMQREIALANRIREEFVPTDLVPMLTAHPEAFSKGVYFTVNFDNRTYNHFYMVDKMLARHEEFWSQPTWHKGPERKISVPNLAFDEIEAKAFPTLLSSKSTVSKPILARVSINFGKILKV